MKTMKKIVAILAVALLLCSVLPLSVMAADTEIVFNLGANGSASHADGSSKTTYTETVSGYTLNITNGTQFYTGARDAKGNSCLKLGSSSKTGSFQFTVPNDVTSVIISVAQYKANTTKMTIAGKSYTITTASNNGAYTDITVDTTSTKTISVATASGGVRAMVNTIKFVIPAAAGDCEHTNAQYEHDCLPTVCPDCEETLPALADHSYEENVTLAPTCTEVGEKTLTCACGDVKTETVKALGHTYVDGFCSACGAELPLEATITFGDDKAQRTEFGTESQKWEHDGLVFINNKGTGNNIADYANPVRLYKNSQIIISFPGMTSLVIDGPASADYAWDATLADYTFTKDNGVYTITFAEPTDSITLTAANQVRANKITASRVVACAHEYDNACDVDCNLCYEAREVQHSVQHVEAKAATCVAMGNIEFWYCDACGMAWLDEACTLNTNMMAVKLPATGEHTYDNDFDADCNVCGAVRDIACPLNNAQKSISEDVNGYAVKFDCAAEGFGILPGTFVQADYTNATYNGYKLVKLGVKASNGVSETTIEGLRMYDLEDGVAKFAFRVINIPADKLDTEITMTPYYVVEIDGVETTLYGEAVVGSYTEIAG